MGVFAAYAAIGVVAWERARRRITTRADLERLEQEADEALQEAAK